MMDRMGLDKPITLEEIQRDMKEMAGQKSPGPDGLPAEIYRHLRDDATPGVAEGL